MKICIIGGSGFVGSRLIKEIEQEHRVLNIDKQQSQEHSTVTTIGDVRNKEQLIEQMKGQDVVVLLAAEHRDDISPISLYYDVNVQGAQNVCDAMQSNNIKHLIFTGSVAVYGLNKDNPNEEHVQDPFNHYGKSKWQAEEVLREWQKQNNDCILTIIRPTVIFGENNRGNVYNLLKTIASGNFKMVGKGHNKKSMAYIGNIVAFIKFLINNKHKESYTVYNYVDKPDMDMNSLVQTVGNSLDKKISSTHLPYWLGLCAGYGFDILASITRKKQTISSVRVKKFCATTQFDSTKMLNSGFTPPFTLEQGLERTVQYEFMGDSKENEPIFEGGG